MLLAVRNSSMDMEEECLCLCVSVSVYVSGLYCDVNGAADRRLSGSTLGCLEVLGSLM